MQLTAPEAMAAALIVTIGISVMTDRQRHCKCTRPGVHTIARDPESAVRVIQPPYDWEIDSRTNAHYQREV